MTASGGRGGARGKSGGSGCGEGVEEGVLARLDVLLGDGLNPLR